MPSSPTTDGREAQPGVRQPDGRCGLRLCIDDFGIDTGVNEAVRALAPLGRVHAVSCMVGGPAWPAARQQAPALKAAGIELGLHLDLTQSPLLPASRRRLGPLILACLFRRARRADLQREVDAQLDAFESALGQGPAYIDGHQHVHQLPQVREVLLDTLERRYGARPPWVRSTRPVLVRGSWLKPLVIAALGGRGFAALADRRGLRHNSRLLGVYRFGIGADAYCRLMRRWLRAAQPDDLLMCHPSAQPGRGDALSEARHIEFELLRSADFATMAGAVRGR